MQVGVKEIDAFSKKIDEATRKLQPMLPKKLSNGELIAINELVRAYVTYTVKIGGRMHTNLNSLINYAAHKATDEVTKRSTFCEKEVEDYIIRMRRIVKASSTLSDIENNKLDENVPALELVVSNDMLGIKNHVNQYLYSTDESKYRVTPNYLVKAHAWCVIERKRKEEQRDQR